MNVITGDLLHLALAGRFDVIVHGCNCQCAMGKGIALSIKQQFPEAYAADLATPRGDRAKLGTFSAAEIHRPPARFTVVNAYTQFHYRAPASAPTTTPSAPPSPPSSANSPAAESPTPGSAPASHAATGQSSPGSSTKRSPAKTIRWSNSTPHQ